MRDFSQHFSASAVNGWSERVMQKMHAFAGANKVCVSVGLAASQEQGERQE
jgi:hypothetical protein